MAQQCHHERMEFPHLKEALDMFGDEKDALKRKGRGTLLMREVCPDCGFDRAEATVHGFWVGESVSCLNCSERFEASDFPDREELEELEVDR